jgi:N-acetylglucosamine kinase-like BadF-type ATPase
MAVQLIADSGATKCEWCLLTEGKKKTITTHGISPYFLNEEQIVALLQKDLLSKLGKVTVEFVHYYGTGLGNANNVTIIKKILKKVFPGAKIEANDDMLAAARALNGRNPGLTCNLGTGSFSCYYNGKKITKSIPGIGYILGDEGSGAYLGKKVIQHYLYQTFDEDLMLRFEKHFGVTKTDILENVYKKPLANRYLASFTLFLVENRGHFMVENIIEDGLNDFFYNNINKYRESWTMPVNFIGSIAFGFKDVLKELCDSYELELGKIMQKPMSGLVTYHSDGKNK